MKRLGLNFVLVILCVSALAQTDFSKVEIKVTHLAGHIYMLQGSGGNIAVSAGPDGILMVDDQFAPLAEKIEAALQHLNAGNVKFVLNTHFHGDHTGGNAHFGREAPIIAHENVRRHLKAGAPKVEGGLPVITFQDSVALHFNGEEIKVKHISAAHTDSDSIVYFTGANVIHFGDTFFSGRFPNIDLGGGGDVRGYIRNIEAALTTVGPDTKLIPGHGPLSTIQELKDFHEMLVATSGVVEKAFREGKTLEQVKEAGLPEKWHRWAAPTLNVNRWIEILYKGLSRPPQ